MLLGNTRKWDKGFPNNHLSTMISNAMSTLMDDNDLGESRTDNDSHKNMVVVGKHAVILANNGNKVDMGYSHQIIRIWKRYH